MVMYHRTKAVWNLVVVVLVPGYEYGSTIKKIGILTTGKFIEGEYYYLKS